MLKISNIFRSNSYNKVNYKASFLTINQNELRYKTLVIAIKNNWRGSDINLFWIRVLVII